MDRLLRLLALILLLNLLRYLPIGYIESLLVLDPLFAAMAADADYFVSEFTTFLWVSSYFYNFVMWSVIVIAYHLFHGQLPGNSYQRSLRVFGFMWVFFAAVSAIYMNHYSHPPGFYLWSVVDALLVYLLMALANGLLYPLLVPGRRDSGEQGAVNE